MALGDFPQADIFRKGLEAFDLSEFPAISKRLLDVVDGALTRDIPKLMIDIGMTIEQHRQNSTTSPTTRASRTSYRENTNGAQRTSNSSLHNDYNSNSNLNSNLSHNDSSSRNSNPFDSEPASQSQSTNGSVPWAVSTNAKRKWDSIFQSLHPSGSPPSLNGITVTRRHASKRIVANGTPQNLGSLRY